MSVDNLLSNFQTDTPEDSSVYFDTLEDWVTQGISEFLFLISLAEPPEFRLTPTISSQVSAMRLCADVFSQEVKLEPPRVQTLVTYYQYSLMDFVASIFRDVPKRLLPSTVSESDAEDYIEDVIVKILRTHEGMTKATLR